MSEIESLSYSYIDFVGNSINDIQKETYGSILVWIVGSAYYDNVRSSEYECILEYKGKVKYLSGKDAEKTANGIMVEGLFDAVSCIVKPMNVIVITANSLGLRRAFRGTGPNASRLNECYKMLMKNGCTLTEGRYTNGASTIRKYIQFRKESII